MDIKAAFGKAVKLRRVEIDLSQEDMANSAGMARSFISKVERGDANPSVTSVKKIADTLGGLPSDLWLKAEGYLSK
ncbi:helix-turn-helix domain-containing protein [Idiomarina zobellii]|uniref:XRE family transcriptional regulator n=1 Tax=Idiomarina zobellii TaxID=86103 RepID=A0A837NI64_9GAMM|nr:helix-turn-helix transcriptional regulator [Idiomarina zobellii]KPD24025.1 XRE family transcriptional regulator [Idiomarina zobellii]SDF82926.1 Helix-turn-helix [Idiomarina zobellii]